MDSADAKRTHAATEPEQNSRAPAASDFFQDRLTIGTALEAGQIGIWSWNAASNTVTWSSNVESICGLPAGSFDGTFAFVSRTIHEDDRDGVIGSLNEAWRNEQPYWARYRMAPNGNGEERWIESIGTLMPEGAAPRVMVGACYDVTERIKLERELRSRVKQQQALAQFGERALAESDLERLLSDVVNTVALTLPVDLVEVIELLPGNSDLLLRAGFGWKSGYVGSVVTSRTEGHYAWHILESAVPIVVDDFAAEKRFVIPQYLCDHHCVSGASTTIAGRDGRAYGILGVCIKKPWPFTLQETSFLAAVGNLVAGAIQRRQLEDPTN